jgi:hypothetical protein
VPCSIGSSAASNDCRTKLERLPRMADFALWGTACERQPGAFMRAYERNCASAVEFVLEADLVATTVRAFMAARNNQDWEGTAAQLLQTLTDLVPDNQRRGRNDAGRPRRGACPGDSAERQPACARSASRSSSGRYRPSGETKGAVGTVPVSPVRNRIVGRAR